MPILDDWNINFTEKVISHKDGVLAYTAASGTTPILNDYVLGTTSGAVGKVIGGSDLGGVIASGTLVLTNVIGRFQTAEPMEHLSELPFNAVSNNGFTLGDSLTGPGSENIDVRAVEYNIGDTAGEGIIFGDNFTGAFDPTEQIDIVGGQADVANVLASGTNHFTTFAATTDSTLTVPGTADTNDSIIIHYDAGTIAVPEDATIADASTGAIGLAQRVSGVTGTGSIVVINSDITGGVWTDNNTLNINDVVFFDNQVAGKVFAVGNVVVGSVSGASGRVLSIIDDGDSTGKLVLANRSGGAFNDAAPDLLQVKSVTIAEVENTTAILAASVINIPNGVRTEQRIAQGGIYASTESLNIVRSSNALYTFLQDTFDELGHTI